MLFGKYRFIYYVLIINVKPADATLCYAARHIIQPLVIEFFWRGAELFRFEDAN